MSDGKSLPELDETRFLRPKDEFLVNAQGRPRRASLATLFASRGLVHINDFGAIGDGISHPLSESYSNLKDALADYPAAQSLTDEKDWCAWQAASNYVYARDDSPRPDNWSAGHFVADGNYVINRTITFNHVGAIVEGSLSPTRFSLKGGTSITYRGPNGTLDDPIYIFDFFLFDESRQGQLGSPNYRSGAPPKRKGNDPYSGGGTFRVRHITFRGKDGDMRADAVGVSGFVSGIRIRKGTYCHISWCHFSGTLWDGVKFTDAQLFPTVEYNNFYGVHRDAIAFDSAPNFSTTMWLRNNEFGYVGRYTMLIDCSGSVEASPVIRDNDMEHTYSESFFVRHPEWFVHGVVAGVCIIQAGNLAWDDNRFEGTTDQTPGYWADLHLIGCTKPKIIGGILRNLALTALPARGDWRTPPMKTYYEARLHRDVSDLRSYNIGTTADHSDNESIHFSDTYNALRILCADSVGLSTSNTHSFANVNVTYLSMPITDGPAGRKIVQPRSTAIVNLMPLPANLNLRNCLVTTSTYGPRWFGHFFSLTSTGDYWVKSGGWGFGTWEPAKAYASNTYPNSPFVAPRSENGRTYQCVVTGVSGAIEPKWPSTIGEIVVDGTVTWRCVGNCSLSAEEGAREWMTAGLRNRTGTAPPMTGEWSEGSKIWSSAPTAGGSLGWVCVRTGSPGIWKSFGAVEA